MGEKSIVEIADALNSGIGVRDLTFIQGTVYRTKDLSGITGGLDEHYNAVILPSYEEMKADPFLYAKSFKIQYQNTDAVSARPLAEKYTNGVYVVQNPPQSPLTTEEMDDIYSLSYQRTYHPSYQAAGGVPAVTEIRFSLISSRGCFGGCSFCALTFHQGRMIQTRSHPVQSSKKPVYAKTGSVSTHPPAPIWMRIIAITWNCSENSGQCQV